MSRPVVLLPPSKAKADGGTNPAYGATIGRTHPLAAPRRAVMGAAVEAAASLSDADLSRVTGVGAAHVPAARIGLGALAEAPSLPAHQRYSGIVHGNAGLAQLDPQRLDVDVRIVSGLLGLVGLDEQVPPYRLEFAASLPPLGGLSTFWRDRLGAYLLEIAEGVRVWDLLPGEHARMWPPGVRDQMQAITVRFLRPDGRAANAARTKVAKGRLAAWLIAAPGADPASVAAEADLGQGWSLTVADDALIATFIG